MYLHVKLALGSRTISKNSFTPPYWIDFRWLKVPLNLSTLLDQEPLHLPNFFFSVNSLATKCWCIEERWWRSTHCLFQMSPGSSISYGRYITWNLKAATYLCNINVAPIYGLMEVVVLFKAFLSLKWSFCWILSAQVSASRRSCQSFLVCNEVHERSTLNI